MTPRRDCYSNNKTLGGEGWFSGMRELGHALGRSNLIYIRYAAAAWSCLRGAKILAGICPITPRPRQGTHLSRST